MQGKTWPHSESIKKCRFCYAKIQGDPNAVNADANHANVNTNNGLSGSSTTPTPTSSSTTSTPSTTGMRSTLRSTNSKFASEEGRGKH